MRRLALILALVIVVQAGCDETYSPHPCDCGPTILNAEETIQAIVHAYASQDIRAFEALLASDYTYSFFEPNPDTGETHYDRAMEVRIHQRLFDPESLPPGDPALWFQSVSITMSQQSSFAERPDLYTTAMPPGPLDPARWIATEAVYDANVFLQLQGETDYEVGGRCRFVVIEDRTKVIGEPGKFTIYRWVDLDGATTAYRRPYR